MGFTQVSGSHADLVKRFNERLLAGGNEKQFRVNPGRFANYSGSGQDRIDEDKFIYIDKTGEMRAGYYLKRQPFRLGDEIIDIGNIQLPISESIIDQKYAPLASAILSDCLKRSPLTFGLGGGGLPRPIMKLFSIRGWDLSVVPFYFRVFHPYRFCRRISFLRRTAPRRIGMDILAFTGLASLAFNVIHAVGTRRTKREEYSFRSVNQFDTWADEIWDETRTLYPFAAVRTHSFLNFLHKDEKLRRICVSNQDGPIGWAVCLATNFASHRQFGSLRVGSIIDVFSYAGMEQYVVEAATEHLQEANVDIVISNQLHHRWGTAFKAMGYLQGPSNFALACSPELQHRCESLGIKKTDSHMTRADGDGPINL